MDEKTAVITEKNGTYQIQNNGISEFALLGILECIIFEMKSASRQSSGVEQKTISARQEQISLEEPNEKHNNPIQKSKETETPQESKAAEPETKREIPQQSTVPDLRTRISNAIKAIRGLGTQIEDTDLSNLTDEELQSELKELTSQYKRLKSSKGNK